MLFAFSQYQLHLSQRDGILCRYRPTCSHYGITSVREYGALIGGARTAWRILRCGPWVKDGTLDPP